MATVPMDAGKVMRCRDIAERIAADVQRYIDTHTTVGVERTILRAYGAEGVDHEGVPLVNTAVDCYARAGLLGRGIAFFLGRALLGGKDGAERRRVPAFSAELDAGDNEPGLDAVRHVLVDPTEAALARIDTARDEREELKRRVPTGPTPLKYVIVATGNIFDDAVQAKAAAHAGADVVAVIRATAQSLLDDVPHGATTEGYGGTFATQENFRIIRRALNEFSQAGGRYVLQANYSSGLCMAEIAGWPPSRGSTYFSTTPCTGSCFATSTCAGHLSYSIRVASVHCPRGHHDQYGEDNYLTTANAVEKAHTVLASQFINEAFALRAGLRTAQMGLGHAYEIDPWLEDSFLSGNGAGAAHPTDFRLPSDQMDAADQTQNGRHLLCSCARRSIRSRRGNDKAVHRALGHVQRGRFTTRADGPLPRPKATRYVYNACKHLGDEMEFRTDGIVARRAVQVLDEALELLVAVERDSISGMRSARAHSLMSSEHAPAARVMAASSGAIGIMSIRCSMRWRRARRLRARTRNATVVLGLRGAFDGGAPARAELSRRLSRVPSICGNPLRGARYPYRRMQNAGPPRQLRAYGDREGDGMVQMSFVLQISPSPRGRSGQAICRNAWPGRPSDRHDGGLRGGLLAFVVYGHSRHAVDEATVNVSEIRTERLEREEIEQRIRTRLRRKSSWSVPARAATRTPSASTQSSITRDMRGIKGSRATRDSKSSTSAHKSKMSNWSLGLRRCTPMRFW